MRLNLLLLTFAAMPLCSMAQTGTANYNVVVSNETTNRLEATHIELYADYPLAIPYDFDVPANGSTPTVTIHRHMRSGYNTFYLPFFVNRDEIPSTDGKTYIYTSQDDGNVRFDRKDGIDANVPFLMTNVTEAEVLNFMFAKGVVNTPTEDSESLFKGNYDGAIGAEGKWGIGNDDKFVRGGASATIKSFAAFFTTSVGDVSTSKQIVLSDFEVDGINTIDYSTISPFDNLQSGNNAVYDLQGRKIANGNWSDGKISKGIYIINGKKILVK